MRRLNLALVLFIVVVLTLVQESTLQSATVSVNNQALFGLGAVLLASGVFYHVGRQHGQNDNPNQFRGGGGRRQNGFPFFGGRKRRQAEEIPFNELDPMVGQLFQMALDRDTTGCSLQLACAIGKSPSASLSGHAKNLNRVLSFENEKTDTTTKTSWNGLDAHKTARNLGRDGGNCDQLFPYCPHTSEQLVMMFQKLQVLEN